MRKNMEGRPGKKITIVDLAWRLGISPATVSNALTGERYVKKETIERVKKIVKELDYKPNIIAKALRSKKRNIIGLLTPNINNPFTAEIISGVEDVLSKNNYILVINSTHYKKEAEIEAVEQLNSLLVGGFIFVGGISDFSHVSLIISKNVPVVLINREITKSKYTEIIVDYKRAVKKIISYLLKKGHTRIGYVGWKNNSALISKEKYVGYIEGLKENNLKENKNFIFVKDDIPVRVFRDYRQYAKEIYSSIIKEKITALIVQTDPIALVIMDTFHRLKMNIGNDISIVGLGNIRQSQISFPPLTTVHLPKIRMGRFGAEVLLELMSKGINKKQTIYLRSTLIERDSVKDISK